MGSNDVTGAVNTSVGEILGAYLEENPKEAKAIVQKVTIATQALAAARNWPTVLLVSYLFIPLKMGTGKYTDI